jgi:hypothetical protein
MVIPEGATRADPDVNISSPVIVEPNKVEVRCTDVVKK